MALLPKSAQHGTLFGDNWTLRRIGGHVGIDRSILHHIGHDDFFVYEDRTGVTNLPAHLRIKGRF